MIRYFKKKKHLKILVIIGLLCPASDHANELVIAFCKKYVIDVITKKIGEKALEYMAGSALMASLAAHLKVSSDSFIKSDWEYAQELTKDTKQALTPAVKKVAKKVSIEVASHAAKEVIQKKVVLPAPVNVSSKIPLNPPSTRRSAHSCTLISAPTPTVTFAIANTQNIVSKASSETQKAPSSSFTRTTLGQVIINKVNQNSTTPALVKQLTQIPSPTHTTTYSYKQTNNYNARPEHSSTPPMFTVRAEAIPIDRTLPDDGKSIIRQTELAHQIQRFTANNKPFLDEIQRKLNDASQQSSNPHIIKEQLSLLSHVIAQPNLNGELRVKKEMMLEHLFNSNGEFQGCYSADQQKQLEEYAKGDLFTLKYSAKRTLSWVCDKIKNFGASRQLAQQIVANPYNVNLYNFVIQFEAKNFEAAVHYLNLIRPDNLLDSSSKVAIYKNMYESFISQFINAPDPSTLADKMSVVCKDHSNPVIRDIFYQFFTENTIFKKYVSAYVKNYQDIQIPKEIATQKFTELRTLYLKLVTMHPANEQKVQQIRQGLLYIKEACSENQHATIFTKLAHSMYQQIASAGNSTILHCRNFAQSFSSPEAQQIQQEVLPFISKATDLLQSVANPLDDSVKLNKQCAQEILANANILYDALAHGDLPKARFIKEHILPTLTPEYVKAHSNPLQDFGTSVPASLSSFSLPQLLAAKLAASIPNIPPSINSPCSIIEDKSKNLQQSPNQCMPEIKIPVPECHMPSQDSTSIKSCESSRFESDAERRINAEIEEYQNKAESGEESRGRQCNWSQQKQLESFNVNSSEQEKNDSPKSNAREDNSKEIVIDIEKIKRRIIEGKPIRPEHEQTINEFLEVIKELAKKYGKENVLEALEAYNINLHKASRKTCLIAINELTQILNEINLNPLFKTFKYDIAHNNGVTQSSILEALAGKACMEQKILSPLQRAKNDGQDFVEICSGKEWDVKTARSYSLEGLPIFIVKDFIKALEIAYSKNENIIIQITDLSEIDLKTLYENLAKKFSIREFEKTVIIHAKDPSKSKKSEELIKFLRTL